MSDQRITIRRAYVTECERFWREAPVKCTHNKVTNSKTLTNLADAKSYIDTAAKNVWDLDTSERRSRMFINTLKDNCEQAGASATQYFTAQYCPGQQYGICKYILVIIYNCGAGKITVAYAYHDIEENLFGSNSVYTQYAEAITEHWLKSKSVESIKEILESNAWPTVIYE